MYGQHGDSKDLSSSPNVKPLIASSATTSPACYSAGRFSPTYKSDTMRRCMTNVHQGRDYGGGFLYGQPELFGSLGDGLLARSEMLASGSVDMVKPLRHDGAFLHPHVVQNASAGSGSINGSSHNSRQNNQMGHTTIDTMDMMEALSASTAVTPLTSMADQGVPSISHPSLASHPPFGSHSHHGGHPGLHGSSLHTTMYTHAAMGNMMASHSHPGLAAHHPSHHPHSLAHPLSHGLQPHHLHAGVPLTIHDADSDPRELEAFAERFKQRRIKLGVTQADVGKALANLRLPGVGALSQSTICRFESLTLSHNNMIALKPILHAWLEEAEAQARNKRRDPDAPSVLPLGEKKRKRTSIAAPEKRSLEAYFAVQPRPSSEKIAAIAEKLDLKKNVVRVWFCNQRQKQKRMKFAAQHAC